MQNASHDEQSVDANDVTRVLDLARWAPSGDNTQPWRFEHITSNHIVIHGHDTREKCVYDLTGQGSQIGIGALIETIALAATTQHLTARFEQHPVTDHNPETKPTFDVYFHNDTSIAADSLAKSIEHRVTQRRCMKMAPLTKQQKAQLQRTLPPGFNVHFFEGATTRLRIAKLLFQSAHIRLTTEEAFRTHQHIFEWRSQFSNDRIPDQAVGLDPLTTRLMQWAMQSWSRATFLNRYLAGTIMPRVQLDFLPGYFCAAHFVLTSEKQSQNIESNIATGRALQRFWLTATQLGLQFQPEMTPLIFTNYVKHNTPFTTCPKANKTAASIATKLENALGHDTLNNAVFMGRLGQGNTPKSRSKRRPLSDLFDLLSNTNNDQAHPDSEAL